MIDITEEMSQAFLTARDAEFEAGRPGKAYLAGLRAVADIIECQQQTEREQLLTLIRDLVDDDDCQYDHHGGCQTHGYLLLDPGEQCPHAEAKELLNRQ